jgi:hypothetical protein
MQPGITQVYQLTEGSQLACVALPQRHITILMNVDYSLSDSIGFVY